MSAIRLKMDEMGNITRLDAPEQWIVAPVAEEHEVGQRNALLLQLDSDECARWLALYDELRKALIAIRPKVRTYSWIRRNGDEGFALAAGFKISDKEMLLERFGSVLSIGTTIRACLRMCIYRAGKGYAFRLLVVDADFVRNEPPPPYVHAPANGPLLDLARSVLAPPPRPRPLRLYHVASAPGVGKESVMRAAAAHVRCVNMDAFVQGADLAALSERTPGEADVRRLELYDQGVAAVVADAARDGCACIVFFGCLVHGSHNNIYYCGLDSKITSGFRLEIPERLHLEHTLERALAALRAGEPCVFPSSGRVLEHRARVSAAYPDYARVDATCVSCAAAAILRAIGAPSLVCSEHDA